MPAFTRVGRTLLSSCAATAQRLGAMNVFLRALASAGLVMLTSCGDSSKADGKKQAGPPPTLVTAAEAEVRPIEITEHSVGVLENFMDPKVGAEVAGRVVSVQGFTGKKVRKGDLLAEIDAVDLEIQARGESAEIARLEALVANQERIVANQQKLLEKGFISQNALDDAVAQRSALREQLKGARAKLDSNRNAQRKTRVVSPIDGEVELQIVAPGDYVKVGDPLFQLVGVQRLHAHLPFPESAAPRLKIGQTVKLSSPLVPGKVVEARVDEIRPTVTAASRALDVIVKFSSDGSFRGGGTVNAEIVTGRKEKAVVVPEQSVILRPAGKVVYVLESDRATQRVVETGIRTDGFVEIISGLSGGETLAADGAGFLTHNATIAVAKPRPDQPGLITNKGAASPTAEQPGATKSAPSPTKGGAS
jgi:membrane fusion protein (multidrug efflux system)